MAAILILLIVIGAFETAQYVFVDILPKSYDHVSDMVEALIIFALIILLVRWRHYALYGQELVRQLREAEQWREDMTAMLIHDLKNPVIGSGLALQAVLRRQATTATLSEQELEFLRMARDSQVRLGDMIGDLLTIAQAENGVISLEREPVDLCAIVTEVVAEMTPVAEQSNLDLRNDCAPAVLHGDASRLRRVVGNLLANAIKFTPSGGHVTVTTVSRAGQVELRVRDTGPGVPREAQERIFEKFGQAVAGQRMSIGLGLTFCKLVAEAHGGSIRVESEPGEGSTFIVTLPAGEGDGGTGAKGPGAEAAAAGD